MELSQLNIIKKELDAFPQLIAIEEDGGILIQGTIPIITLNEGFITNVRIKLLIPSTFPKDIPKVFETGGRFNKLASEYCHFNKGDSSCCLFLPEERAKYFKDNGTISEFLKGPVNTFFLNQLYFEQSGNFPHGQRGHGTKGSVEYFKEEYQKFTTNEEIKMSLKLLRKKKIKSHYQCPFGCGNFLECDTHRSDLMSLRKKIGRKVIHDSFKTFSFETINNNRKSFILHGYKNRKTRRIK